MAASVLYYTILYYKNRKPGQFSKFNYALRVIISKKSIPFG